MRIGFNGRYLQKTPSGIEYYLLNLINALTKMDSQNEYYLFLNRQPFKSLEMKNRLDRAGAKIRVSDWPSRSSFSRLIWDYAVLPRDLKKERIDIFHGSSFSVPLAKTCPSVVSIHDLAFSYFPEGYPKASLYYFRILLPLVVKQANMIITDSESSRRDIVDMFAVPTTKVAVVYHGIGSDFRIVDDPDRLERVQRKYRITREFMLNVSGLITPRKNLITLFESYAKLRRKHIMNHQLVVVGKPGWLYSKIFETVARLGLQEDVVFTGPVPYDDLIALYNAAKLLVFPSWYEGFGYPVLESMACGTPVVASNVSSLPEIVGAAGLLVNPADKDELADSINRVLEDDILKNRLIKRGLLRAKSFTWEKTARQTLRLYERTVSETNG